MAAGTDSSGEAEIARMRIEDAEPETVRHSRHVQGHALISDARHAWRKRWRGNINLHTLSIVDIILGATMHKAHTQEPCNGKERKARYQDDEKPYCFRL